MHVVTVSDRNYLTGVLVLIASVKRHNPSARFSLLTLGYDAAALAKIAELRLKTGAEIDVVEVPDAALEGLKTRRAHLTKASFARELIARLLPAHDRAIYMDCDMVCTGPMDEAWEIPLEGRALAAVPCPTPSPAALAVLSLRQGDYVNTGLMVLDLALWRREGIGEQCLARLADPACIYVTQDESAINDVCRGRIAHLPSGFNVYASLCVTQPAFHDISSIRVIHYIVTPKPWYGDCYLGEIWDSEARRLGDLVPPRERGGLRQRLRHLNGYRRIWMGKLVGKPKHLEHARKARIVARELLPLYLATGSLSDGGR